MNKSVLHIMLLLVLAAFSSCGVHRKNVVATDVMLTEALLEKVEQNELKWEWFSAKLNIQTENGVVSNLGGQIRMQRDSVIWMSVTAFMGIEAGRIMITPDSLFFLNKLDNSYAKESFDKLRMRFGTSIGFSDFQDALLGNGLWVLGNGEMSHEWDCPYYEVGNSSGYDKIWVEGQTFRTAKAYHAERYFQLLATYGGFEIVGGNSIPTEIGLDLKGMYNFAGQMRYSSVTLNEKVSFPFKITSKMKRMRL